MVHCIVLSALTNLPTHCVRVCQLTKNLGVHARIQGVQVLLQPNRIVGVFQ